ncbi:LINE-1 retrotransposable element ORF1 protein [Anabarilius grahami]|uniref:LINE-1 retrotransposable element ORF1 protein n=1 Tax=Anabarilius grahami TaxID=495550 RepID=A0A3N0Y4F8_ANAGA|nr:LINE-1 retrotransposable element ORF1 protein [Anabarilius grahami]
MSLILSEIKANGSRLDGITSRLEGIANSVSCLQNSFAVLTERVAGAETRLDEAERRISSVEDSAAATEGQLASLKVTVDQLQTKIDDLENRGRRKNLKIVGLPEKSEGSGPLSAFLRDMIPKWLDLPADFPALDIERAHRSPTFASNNPNSAPRSILVRFLRFTDKEEILKVALKKTVTHNGSELRFYSDLSAGLLQKRREFATVGKALAARGLYRGFAYPARLRCLHIKMFNDPKSAKVFLDSLDD